MLMVEDDDALVHVVRGGLAPSQVIVHHAPTLAEADRLLAHRHQFDAIILDLSLPDGNGVDLAASCRASGSEVPIIMVTARHTVGERVAGLKHGADDYLCKPFAVEELSARLEAVVRRSGMKNRHILKYGDVELDLLKRRVRRDEAEVSLSTRELDLLAYLMSHPEEVLSKDKILREVWGGEEDQQSNVLPVYANYLRNKLEHGFHPRILHTVRGVGYILSHEDPTESLTYGWARGG